MLYTDNEIKAKILKEIENYLFEKWKNLGQAINPKFKKYTIKLLKLNCLLLIN
jgi:hypothetical protein